MSEKRSGVVRFTFDPLNPPRMSDEECARLSAMRDEDIDFSDAPEQVGPPIRWVGPRLNGETVLPLDKDVAEFFRSQGALSRDKVNAVLREYAEAHRKQA